MFKMCNLVISHVHIAILFASFGFSLSFEQQKELAKNGSLSSDDRWTCVEMNECKFWNPDCFNLTRKCGHNKICCPKPLPQPTQAQIDEANSIALKECRKYEGYRFHNYTDHGFFPSDVSVDKSEYDCGPEVQGFISNGEKVEKKEYPFMALLGFDDDVANSNTWSCSGTLISPQFILTAAHSTIDEPVKWALLGKLERTGITQELRYNNLFKVIKHIIHPDYGVCDKENNDIALLKLEQEVPLSTYIRPICLYHDQQVVRVNSKVLIAGWGVQVAGEQKSEYLQQTSIDVLDESKCVDQYRSECSFQNGFESTTMICGGDLKGKNDLCPNGPMLVPIRGYRCMYLQVGIFLGGFLECGKSKPAIYTRISPYLPWIRSVAWSNST